MFGQSPQGWQSRYGRVIHVCQCSDCGQSFQDARLRGGLSCRQPVLVAHVMRRNVRRTPCTNIYSVIVKSQQTIVTYIANVSVFCWCVFVISQNMHNVIAQLRHSVWYQYIDSFGVVIQRLPTALTPRPCGAQCICITPHT